MDRNPFRTPTTLAALAASCLLSAGCALPTHSPAATPAVRDPAALHRIDGRYVLDHPFRDFYDTAFVASGGGATAPRAVSLPELADILSGYDVVFYGENHAHPGVHLQQMKLLAALYQRRPLWILSFEQFERDVQGVLDGYLAGKIGETTLVHESRAWKNYDTSYRPLLEFGKTHHLPVVAAEAPAWAVACIGQQGYGILDRFTPIERSWIAQDLHAGPGAYRDKYMQFLGGSAAHGSANAVPAQAAAKAQHSFEAQAARDDTMAESIERALRTHPGYKLLHLTGGFHSEGFLGTVERLQLRDPTLKIAVIDPLEVADPGAPAFEASALRDGTVLQLIYPTPEAFVEGEDMSAWAARMSRERDNHPCKYAPPSAAAPRFMPQFAAVTVRPVAVRAQFSAPTRPVPPYR